MQADSIVFSYGSILYTHMIFFNPKASLKWIAVGNDRATPAYSYVWSRRPEKLYVPNRNLDHDIGTANIIFDRLNSGTTTTPTPPPDAQVVVKETPSSIKTFSELGMRTNSGLLQEHFFVRAIVEAIGTKLIPFVAGVNHTNATCVIELIMPDPMPRIQKVYPIFFPLKRVNSIKELWVPSNARTYKYYFRGVLSSVERRKQWVRQYMKPGNYVEHNTRGRGKYKYVFDTQYYKLMCQSQFVLAPIDVYPWSYRFLEAILCRCIPVINVGDQDLNSNGFQFYRVNQEHVWREDWVESNLKRLMEIFTLSNPNHEFNQIVRGVVDKK
jgi:hypothetical protein